MTLLNFIAEYIGPRKAKPFHFVVLDPFVQVQSLKSGPFTVVALSIGTKDSGVVYGLAVRGTSVWKYEFAVLGITLEEGVGQDFTDGWTYFKDMFYYDWVQDWSIRGLFRGTKMPVVPLKYVV